MKEQIVNIIREAGPVVPNELTSKLGKDSFIIGALLSELVKEGLIHMSAKKVGLSALYYLKGQEEAMRKRLFPELRIPEKKTVEFFEENKLMLKENLSPQQRFIVDSLSDFITRINLNINGEDKIFYKHYSIPSDVIYDELKRMNEKPKVKPQKEASVQESLFLTKAERTKKTKSPKQKTEIKENIVELYIKIDDASDDFFTKNNISILKTESKKSSEASFIGKVNSSIPQDYYIKYLMKKAVGENDISKAYTEAHGNKMPCIIITKGKLNKNAEKLLVKLGSLIMLIKI